MSLSTYSILGYPSMVWAMEVHDGVNFDGQQQIWNLKSQELLNLIYFRVVKHRQLIKSNEEVKDKFLIHIYHHGKNRKTLGKREISATLYSTRVSLGSRLEDNFQALPNGGKVELKQRLVTDDQTLTKWPSMFLISLSMICIAVLMLPNEGTTPDTMVPSFLRVTVNQKCVAAYVLGAITMILLKSYS
eukprot:XP_014789887.1 PREDICTED: motile sperm domain-containing protein 1-like [Octopus bimaculoides]